MLVAQNSGFCALGRDAGCIGCRGCRQCGTSSEGLESHTLFLCSLYVHQAVARNVPKNGEVVGLKRCSFD